MQQAALLLALTLAGRRRFRLIADTLLDTQIADTQIQNG